MADDLLVERPLSELPARLHVALQRQDLVGPEEVLAELRGIELRPEELLLRQRLLLEPVLLHEAERLLVGHLAALELDVEHRVRRDDHPGRRVSQRVPRILLSTEASLDQESRAVDGPP